MRRTLASDSMTRWWPLVALGAVLLAAVALRAWGLDFGLPYLYHADEPSNVRTVRKMVLKADPNPHFFNYPSLFFYVQAAAYGLYLALAQVVEVLDATAARSGIHMISRGNGIAWAPGTVLAGRAVTALAGVGIAAVAYLTAARATASRWAGVGAAVLVALSPLAVDQSRLITPDTYAGLGFAAATLAALWLLDDDRYLIYAVAGVLVGLAASMKYNAALAAVPVAVAHLLRTGWRGVFDPRIYLAGAASVVAFLATTPYAVLDSAAFLSGLRFELGHYARGHAGHQGGALAFYLRSLWTSHGPVLLVLPVALIAASRDTRRSATVLIAGVVGYLVLLSQQTVRFERNLLPILGPVLTLTAIGIWNGHRQLRNWTPEGPAVVAIAPTVIIVAVGAALLVPTGNTFEDARARSHDQREPAREWINANLPAGATVVVEGYGPYLDRDRFDVRGIGHLFELDRGTLRCDADYLVAAERTYGRFVDADGSPRRAARYRKIFQSFREVASFPAGPASRIRVLAAPESGDALDDDHSTE